MDANFPADLSIQASNPSLYLSYIDSRELSVCPNPLPQDDAVVLLQNNDIESYGIAGRIWEAAYAMIFYVNPPTPLEFNPQCSICDVRGGAVVELGAGNGYLGLNMARMISRRQEQQNGNSKTLVLTDLEPVCPLLERNTRGDIHGAMAPPFVDLLIRPLEWGNLEHGRRLRDQLILRNNSRHGFHDPLVSHIVCSDLVYFPELFSPLLRSLLQLTSPPFSTATQPVEVIISYMVRSIPKEMPFWNTFSAWFNFTPVLVRNISSSMPWERFGDQGENTLFIFIATRKLESFDWTLPDDVEVMRREDDTFETILLMSMYPGVTST
ncbi:hypothetical protein K439DRAFT_1332591 [Ramaria rubella]|nr:hypothetical protein K439DRAFT_1332591 [Ramaria rubella]